MLTNTKFSYYPSNVKIPNPLGEVTLAEFIRANKNPNPKIREIFEKIAEAENVGDMKLKSELKQGNLYYFTPCVRTDGLNRGYANITSFTGLLVLDFDHIDNAEEFKQFLFGALKSVVCCFLSPSKKGIKLVVRIPIVKTVDEFKSYFYGLAYHLEKYEGFDGTAQNPCLPIFLSFDENLLQRDDAEVWTTRGYKVDEFKKFEGEIIPVENVSEEDQNRIKDILSRSMSKIFDSGHLIVRSTSLAAGGYVAGGYFEHSELEDFMLSIIDDTPYLQKGRKGYQDTCKQMMQRGAFSPLYLD